MNCAMISLKLRMYTVNERITCPLLITGVLFSKFGMAGRPGMEWHVGGTGVIKETNGLEVGHAVSSDKNSVQHWEWDSKVTCSRR